LLLGSAGEGTGGSRAAGAGALLVGRSRELARLDAFLDEVRANGASLLIASELGAGKAALLGAAAWLASVPTARVMRAVGTEFVAGLSYAALNQLLLPLREEFGRVSPACRDALDVALGFGAGPALTGSSCRAPRLSCSAKHRSAGRSW
jgi:hypothetical protein